MKKKNKEFLDTYQHCDTAIEPATPLYENIPPVVKKLMKATVTWKPEVSGMAFEGIGPSGHKLLMDAVEKFGGADKGVRPFEIMLLSLGGCTAMDVISILKKKKIEPLISELFGKNSSFYHIF